MTLERQQIGRYHLVRLLGSGGMGDVYLAQDARIGQQVAIKVIRAELSTYADGRADEQAARLFLREARAISRLDHPNILPLFDFGEEQIGDTSIMYLVMPFRQEGSLASWLRYNTNGVLLPPQKVAHFLQQAAAALQHAHSREVIHQDVKPSNFLLRMKEDSQEPPDLLLADFGIARFITATSSASQSIRGTPSYMAPEQWEGEAVYASDQYALAVMAYELLTGRLPFLGGPGKMMYQHINVQPQPPSSLNVHLSKDIDTVLLRALAKQHEQRFDSITAFARAFQQAVQGLQGFQITPPAPNLEAMEPTRLPGAIAQANALAPTMPRSNTLLMGNDSETYVKPVDTPLPLTITPSTPFHTQAAPVENAPVTTTTRSKPRSTRRLALMASLIVLALALVGGGITYALPMLLKNSSSNNGNGATTGTNRPGTNTTTNTTAPGGTSPGGTGTETSAIVSITPATRNLSNTFTIIAAPNPSQQQARARVISISTSPQSLTAPATGQVIAGGVQASGILDYNGISSVAVTIPAGTVYTASNGVQVVTDSTITIPASVSGDNVQGATVSAHAIQTGTAGNVAAQSINASVSSGNVDWWMTNQAPFTGGQDAQTYTAVQQSDIDNAANQLEQTNTPNAQQVIQSQMQPNEQLVGTPACSPHVSANQQVGARVNSVMVTVSFTCVGNVYDTNAAQQIAAQLLNNQAKADPGKSYALKGNSSTTIISATLTNASQGTVSVQVSVTGTWVYQFSATQQQQFAQLIAGKSKQVAQSLLMGEPGVSNASIQLQGSSNSLPTDPGKISITIQ